MQSLWDNVLCHVQAGQLKPMMNQHRQACFNASNTPRSGASLNAVHSMAVGKLLDGDSLRIALSQRLGLRMCRMHKSRCGATIDELALHPLSCRFSTGRHPAINDVIQRALNATGFPSQLESL